MLWLLLLAEESAGLSNPYMRSGYQMKHFWM